MQDKHLAVPGYKDYEYAYGQSYQVAREQFARIDIEQQCRNSDAQYQSAGTKEITIRYLNQAYRITLPDIVVSLVNGAATIPIRDKLLILHYFITAKGTPPTNKLITFKELPEGTVYFPTFAKRTIKPLLDNFSQEPSQLVSAGEKLGGHQANYGDAAVTFTPFSRVPITFILWRGDDEFAPQASVGFDANIRDYLPTEDIIVLCETIVWRLVRSLK
ncbi:MAG: DUF3786 domain-containing protein [Chloroflexota bacterium]